LDTNHQKFRNFAARIAANRGEALASSLLAFRKIFIQEKRDWSKSNAPRIGWKRGELFEFIQAILANGDWRSEWGDVGYYVAQAWGWLWWVYATITPESIIKSACLKFEKRAREE